MPLEIKELQNWIEKVWEEFLMGGSDGSQVNISLIVSAYKIPTGVFKRCLVPLREAKLIGAEWIIVVDGDGSYVRYRQAATELHFLLVYR